MAIDLELNGDFDFSKPLVRTVRGALGANTTVRWQPRPGIEVEIVNDLLFVTGLFFRGTATLLFRVLDKDRVTEAVDATVPCVDAILTMTDGNLKFLFGGDLLLLKRANGKLTLYLTERDVSEDFWRKRDLSSLIHHGFRFVRKIAGPPLRRSPSRPARGRDRKH